MVSQGAMALERPAGQAIEGSCLTDLPPIACPEISEATGLPEDIGERDDTGYIPFAKDGAAVGLRRPVVRGVDLAA